MNNFENRLIAPAAGHCHSGLMPGRRDEGSLHRDAQPGCDGPAGLGRFENSNQIHDVRSPWIGVDLDGTLASDTGGELWDSEGNPKIGRPVHAMVSRIQRWVAAGRTVKIFTARAASPRQVAAIRQWLVRRGLPDLEITNLKDLNMMELWDDRCVQVVTNSGQPVNPEARLRRRKWSSGPSDMRRPGARFNLLFSLKQIFLML